MPQQDQRNMRLEDKWQPVLQATARKQVQEGFKSEAKNLELCCQKTSNNENQNERKIKVKKK